jgi:predicted lipoprotein
MARSTVGWKRRYGSRRRRYARLLGALALALPMLTSCKLVSVRKVDPSTGKVIYEQKQAVNSSATNQKFNLSDFNAGDYVASIWTPKVVPTVESQAVDLPKLVDALKQDESAASSKYGVSAGTSVPYAFDVRVVGVVKSVDTSTPVGVMKLDVAGVSSDVEIAVGPLVLGTALRDSMPFISLNDFTNQVQYANVSQALNKMALSAAFSDVSPKSLVGKTVEFWGAFALQSLDSITITPVQLKEEG